MSLQPAPETPDGCLPVHCWVCIQDGTKTVATWIDPSGHLTCEKHAGADVEQAIREKNPRRRGSGPGIV